MHEGGAIHWSLDSLRVATSTPGMILSSSSCQLPIALQLGMGLHELLPIHTGIWASLIFHRSYIGNHNCELECNSHAVSRDNTSLQPPALSASSSAMLPGCWQECYKDAPLGDILSCHWWPTTCILITDPVHCKRRVITWADSNPGLWI